MEHGQGPLEGMEMTLEALQAAYAGRTALVTGHTGFKGAWLCVWLRALGARVVGYSLPPPTEPSLFALARVGEDVEHHLGDVRDLAALRGLLKRVRPNYVFHLAAQPLVRASYVEPLDTLHTNVVGTANLLEALREVPGPCAVVVVTSDKCYENREWYHGYREADRLGGHDPYSMTKACAELVVAAWRRSFFEEGGVVRIASARAGNVIGGGDWREDRIIPDCVRALSQGQPVPVRNPNAVRPWQHVIEPLGGYLRLAARLSQSDGAAFCEAWNFGPPSHSFQTVRELVEEFLRCWGGGRWVEVRQADAPHEAGLLVLSIEKAAARLGWRPVWSFATAVAETAAWYRDWHTRRRADLRALCLEQIERYGAAAAAARHDNHEQGQ